MRVHAKPGNHLDTAAVSSHACKHRAAATPAGAEASAAAAAPAGVLLLEAPPRRRLLHAVLDGRPLGRPIAVLEGVHRVAPVAQISRGRNSSHPTWNTDTLDALKTLETNHMLDVLAAANLGKGGEEGGVFHVPWGRGVYALQGTAATCPLHSECCKGLCKLSGRSAQQDG